MFTWSGKTKRIKELEEEVATLRKALAEKQQKVAAEDAQRLVRDWFLGAPENGGKLQ